MKLKNEIEAYVANRIQHVVFEEAASLVAHGICDYEDIDTAVAYGPGLRWAFAGPVSCYHLGGGKGGVRHMIDHFGWKRDEKAKNDLIAAVDNMYGHLSIGRARALARREPAGHAQGPESRHRARADPITDSGNSARPWSRTGAALGSGVRRP